MVNSIPLTFHLVNTDPFEIKQSKIQLYDQKMQRNPYYQQLKKTILEKVSEWQLGRGSSIADIGAGTGLLSTELARQFGQATIIHMDQDLAKNAHARRKAQKQGLKNFHVVPAAPEVSSFSDHTLDGVVCHQPLHDFSHPKESLLQMYRWLKPGGKLILADSSRVSKAWSWKSVLGRNILRSQGPGNSLDILQNLKETGCAYEKIQRKQKNGAYWPHSQEAFCAVIRNMGFEIDWSGNAFRSVGKVMVLRKPK